MDNRRKYPAAGAYMYIYSSHLRCCISAARLSGSTDKAIRNENECGIRLSCRNVLLQNVCMYNELQIWRYTCTISMNGWYLLLCVQLVTTMKIDSAVFEKLVKMFGFSLSYRRSSKIIILQHGPDRVKSELDAAVESWLPITFFFFNSIVHLSKEKSYTRLKISSAIARLSRRTFDDLDEIWPIFLIASALQNTH